MNQRERILSLLVGGMLVGAVVWWGLGKYRSAIKRRTNEIASLEDRKAQLIEQRLQGEYANRQMGEYMVRSLPGDAQTAQSRYQKWLLSVMQENDLTEQSVDPTSPRSIGGLYRQFAFRVQGKAKAPDLVDLLHAFYAKDYLHRIRTLSVRLGRSGDFNVEMTVDAIGLENTSSEMPEPGTDSWAVVDTVDAYRDQILNRNLYEPPNNAPAFAGSDKVEVIVGRKNSSPLVFKDPEGQELAYELVEGPKELVSIDERSGTLQVESAEKKSFEVLVRATDNGYPKRVTEQKLTVNVVDPPPPPAPEPPKLKFDDAKQTVLTGLVQGRGEWEAWMHVRTRDKTLKLHVGDSFEIGSVKGTVVEVNSKFAVLESGGKKFELKIFGNLSEGANAEIK